MTRLRRPSKHEAVLSEARRLAAGKEKVGNATTGVAGLMTPEHVAHLNTIEPGANKSWTPQQIEEAFASLEHSIKSALEVTALRCHVHDDRYMPASQLAEHLGRKVDRDDISPENILERLRGVKDDIDAGKLGGEPARAYMLVRELTAQYLVKLLSEFKPGTSGIDATTLWGKSLSWFSASFESRDPAIVKSNKPRVYQAGERCIAGNAGMVGGDKKAFSPDPMKSNMWQYRNIGRHTFKAPVADYDYALTVLVENTSTCGLIEFEGFTSVNLVSKYLINPEHNAVSPDPNSACLIKVTKIGTYIDVEVRALK